MRLIPLPLVIGEEDDYKKAVIDRSEFGNFLTNIVRSTPEPLVIAIDGRWGEGKTTFVKIWRNQLECTGPWKDKEKELKTPALYIDAFKMEATEDIFISLVAEIDSFVKTRCKNEEKLRSLKKTAIELGSKLLPIGAKIAIRAASLNLINPDDFKELKLDPDSISQSLSEQAEKILAERLQSLVNQKRLIDKFREELTAVPDSIEGNQSKQLVIIIDELDRCSPKYAVEFLEKIKHFFSTENIKFVLVINKDQLESSIRAVYGSEVKASEYLQKFIDIECLLPRNDKKLEAPDARKFCDHLATQYQFENSACADRFAHIVSMFAVYGDLTLRQVEKVYSAFAVLDNITNGEFAKVASLRFDISIFACIAKVMDRGFCIKALQGKITESDYSNLVDKIIRKSINDRSFMQYLNSVRHCCMTEPEFLSQNTPLARSFLTQCGGNEDIRRDLLPEIVSKLYGVSE